MSGNKQGRRNWTLSMTVALLAAVAAAVIGSMAGGESAATDRFYLRNTAGPVLFNHGKHKEIIGSCAACHHDLYSSEQAVSCNDCHDDGREPADFEHAELKEFHGRDCSTCHEQRVEDNQAASCRNCHPGTQKNEAGTVACADCHDSSYEPDMMEHDEYLEIEEHSCLGCHAPGSVSETYHASCTNCHLEADAKRFVNDDAAVKCGGCHLR